MWSESLLQCRTVHAWVAKNKDCWKSFQPCDYVPNRLVAYDKSNVVTDLRLGFRDAQTSNELHESNPNGQFVGHNVGGGPN